VGPCLAFRGPYFCQPRRALPRHAPPSHAAPSYACRATPCLCPACLAAPCQDSLGPAWPDRAAPTVLSLPCPTVPGQAVRARPRPAWICHANRALPALPPQPRLAVPDLAAPEPCLACLARPRHAMPSLVQLGRACRAQTSPVRPGPAQPRHPLQTRSILVAAKAASKL
jgi:hypothetical protein